MLIIVWLANLWSKGTWEIGRMKKLLWTQRKFEPIRKVVADIDYITLETESREALLQTTSLALITDAYCRYGRV